VLSCGTVYYAVQGGYNLKVLGWDPFALPIISIGFGFVAYWFLYKAEYSDYQ